jgi:hypothetical protein
MRTDDLIHLLTADRVAPEPPLRGRMLLHLLVGLAASALLFWLLFDPRQDLAEAAGTPRFVAKVATMLLLTGAAAVLILRVARPAARMRPAAAALWAAPLVLLAAVALELTQVPSAQWPEALLGDDWRACLAGIVALALPILGGALLALRAGAPTRPALAGAVAGLLAGGLGAMLYAVHCADDSPLFVAAWYGVAVGLLGVAGAVAGRHVLRW